MKAEHDNIHAYIQITHLSDALVSIKPQTPPAVILSDVAHWWL